MGIAVKTKAWGSSLGVVIPRAEVETLALAPGDEIVLDIHRKANVLQELFGTLKFKKPIRQVIQETRAELEGELV